MGAKWKSVSEEGGDVGEDPGHAGGWRTQDRSCLGSLVGSHHHQRISTTAHVSGRRAGWWRRRRASPRKQYPGNKPPVNPLITSADGKSPFKRDQEPALRCPVNQQPENWLGKYQAAPICCFSKSQRFSCSGTTSTSG